MNAKSKKPYKGAVHTPKSQKGLGDFYGKDKMFDTEDNEIVISDGHAISVGKDSVAFVEINGYSANLVYRAPESSKPLESKAKVYGLQ